VWFCRCTRRKRRARHLRRAPCRPVRSPTGSADRRHVRRRQHVRSLCSVKLAGLCRRVYFGVRARRCPRLLTRNPANRRPVRARSADRAIVRLTILGALAGPVYLPLSEALIRSLGWRSALRVEAGTVTVACLVAGAVLRDSRPGGDGNAPGSVRSALRAAWAEPSIRRWALATLIGTAATDLMLTYRVAIMVALGLSATVATSAAGARGLAQLGGRLPLTSAVRRWGTRASSCRSSPNSRRRRDYVARRRLPLGRCRLQRSGRDIPRGYHVAARPLHEGAH
jgi:hypothetical protein